MSESLRVDITKHHAADWLVRDHLPLVLETVGFTDEASYFRDLPPFQGLTGHGRVIGWAGIVGKLEAVQAKAHKEQWSAYVELRDERKGSPGSEWYHVRNDPNREIEIIDNETEVHEALIFAAHSFAPSQAGYTARRAIYNCMNLILTKHALAEGTSLPQNYRDLFEQASAQLLKSSEVEIHIPLHLVHEVNALMELMWDRWIGTPPEDLLSILRLVGRADTRPILLDLPLPTEEATPMTEQEIAEFEKALETEMAWEQSPEGVSALELAERRYNFINECKQRRKAEFERWSEQKAWKHNWSVIDWRQQTLREENVEFEILEAGGKPPTESELKLLEKARLYEAPFTLSLLRDPAIGAKIIAAMTALENVQLLPNLSDDAKQTIKEVRDLSRELQPDLKGPTEVVDEL